MKLELRQLAWLGAGAVWAILSGTPAVADETELFVGTSNLEQPNILFILDNSGSMGTQVGAQATYSPSTVYPPQGCNALRVYFRLGSGAIPDCSTPDWFAKAALMCNAGVTALASAGQFSDRMAQYDPANTSSGKRWERIDKTRPNNLVECRTDNGNHGDGSPAADRYPRNGTTTMTSAWQNSSGGGGFAWNVNPHTNGDYTIYDGNWLNWAHGPTGFRTRLEVVQEVASNLLDQVNGVNVGLMTFDRDQGGWVVHAMEDIATARTNMQTAVNALVPTGFTPLSETLYEAALYYTGDTVDYGNPDSVAASRMPGNTNTYNSPLTLSCQKNFIVYLTDGEPTQDIDADAKILGMNDANGDSFAQHVGGTCDAEVYPAGFNPSGGECLDELAEYLHDADLSPLPGQQNVDTYTVGFTVNLPILAETAARGGGQYYTADDTATLSNALTNIVTSILNTEVSFTAPAVSVNSLNQTRNLNDLYVSVFRPSGTEHWPGNLKKYRLRSDATVVDAAGNNAINPATGFFSDAAQSFWSATVDGSSIEDGGAANLIPVARNVYTYLGSSALTAPSNRVSTANAGITDVLLNTGMPGEPTRAQIVDYINGLDSPDVDADGVVNESRHQMGDPMNAQPVSVVYGPTTADARVYFATNDGYLHSIDTQTGVEAWSFLPPEFLGDQVDLFQNNSVANKHYGLDGNLRLQIDADSDGVIEPTNGEKVYLYFGMRRGGDTYYALDVTNPNAPTLLWRKDSASFPGIGQSWSTPTPTKIDISGAAQNAQKMVLVIGGGYDATQDDQTASTDPIGNSVYIVDSVSGNLLWRATKVGGTKNFSTVLGNNASMDYSIPADVKVIDVNGDKFADRMYFADMGGQVWRLDITNGQTAANLVTGGVLAQLGSAPLAMPTVAQTRRFYYAPDVAMVSTDDLHYVHIGIGSGHRAHPNATANEDRFYALRDYATFSKLTQAQYNAIVPIKDTDLVDVTNNIAANVPQGSPGWKFELRIGGWRGEKVLAEGRVFNDKVSFTTYTPNAGTGLGCAPTLGLRRSYQISVFNGAPVTNLDGSTTGPILTANDRYTESDGAPLPTAQFLFIADDGEDTNGDGVIDSSDAPTDTNGDGVIDSRDGDCIGTTCPERCEGTDCSVEDLNTNPIRTFWSQETTD